MEERAAEEWPDWGYPMVHRAAWAPGQRYEVPPEFLANCAAVSARFDGFLSGYERRIDDANQARRDDEDTERRAVEAARAERLRNRSSPAPSPMPYGVSHRGAEMLAADWMRHIGISDAAITPAQADGGIDVTSDTHVAQVKHYKGNVGVVELRELHGVAAARGKQGLFFTSTGYTAEAIAFANTIRLPIFIYSAELGTLRGSNEPARKMA